MPLNYSPIVLDSINHDSFPKVELFVKNDTNFALYKPKDTKLTIHNIERLRENGTEFVYIDSVNSEEVQAHIEQRFEKVQSGKQLPPFSKNLICSQIIINCINNVFKHSDAALAFYKCRSVFKLVSLKFENTGELTSLFAKLEQNFEKYLVTHTAQVTILSMYLFEKLFGGSPLDLIDIGVGAMLHDIGMLHVASDITEKTDVLSENEYHRVKTHPKQGHAMLSHMGMRERIPLEIVLDHHERYNGVGYPRGLHEEQISKNTMLVSICDIYCALTMTRPYRSASSPEDALKILMNERKLFDPIVFEGFFRIMSESAFPEEIVDEKQLLKTEPPTDSDSELGFNVTPAKRKNLRRES